MSTKRDYKDLLALWIPLAALVVAVIALVASIKSWQAARDANELAMRQYREERQLVLTGEFTDDGDAVKLKSVSDSITFMEGRAIFPALISKDEWQIRPGDKTLYLTMARAGLQHEIEKRVPREKGFAKVSTDGSIPVLIDAHYASKGEVYLDRSLYLLSVEFVLSDDAQMPPAVHFNGIVFAQRFPPDKWVSREYLDQLMENKEGMYLPPKSP